jgi:hypothetical protein
MWKVYEYMEGGQGKRAPTIYGPLPCKRWIAVKGEKRHKLSYRPRHAYVGNAPHDDNWKAAQAVQYALWLARRDGVEIPADATPRVNYHLFASIYERTSSGRPVYLKHAMSVFWSVKGEVVAQIPIPHCGWEPAPAKETIDAPKAPVFESVRA